MNMRDVHWGWSGRRSWRLGAGFCLGLLAVAANGQGISPEQNKLVAKRAAEVDAYRKLAETVYGLQINARTYVKDFVAESDEIRTNVDTFVKGIRLGDPVWYDDGACEVPAEVTVAKVVEILRESYDRYYDGDDVSVTDIQSITQRVQKQVIKAVGLGAPRADLPPMSPAIAEVLHITPPPPGSRPSIGPVWRNLGTPHGIQARGMAARAARLDAIRRLAERIYGLRLTSRTLVVDFVAQSDEITTDLSVDMPTAGEEVSTYYHYDELIAEVTVRMPMEQVIETIKTLHSRHYKGDDVRGHDIEKAARRVIKSDFVATGLGCPPAKYVERLVERTQVEMPAWTYEPITETGSATHPEFSTPQGRLMAARAAEVDAKRRLAERVFGFTIHGSTTVRDFVAEHDYVETVLEGYMNNATVIQTQFDTATGEARVTVQIPGVRVWEVIHQEMRYP